MITIEEYAFYGCDNLRDVYYTDTEEQWNFIAIESGNDSLTEAEIHYNSTGSSTEDTATVDISTCTITLSSGSYTYDGSAKKPTVTVTLGGETLTGGTDYTVEYSNNTDAGTATVKWAKNSKATGYQIQYSTSSSFSSYKTVTVSKAATVSNTIGSLTKGKTYYVRIRTYKTVSGMKYDSAWSGKKSVKISNSSNRDGGNSNSCKDNKHSGDSSRKAAISC